jgi:hypothetical protein
VGASRARDTIKWKIFYVGMFEKKNDDEGRETRGRERKRKKEGKKSIEMKIFIDIHNHHHHHH